MIYIRHRQNSLTDIKSANPNFGAEIDLRADVDRARRILTSHDPYSAQADLDDWLSLYVDRKFTGPLILNTKADLLEEYLFEALKSKGVHNFLFLDTAIPTLVRYSETPLAPHFMVRFSSFEPPEFYAKFKGKMEWLWLDCFDGIPMNLELVKSAAKDFKICLVSPELHSLKLQDHIKAFLPLIPHCAAICTKHIDVWQSQLER
jgi:hypothetical protein